MMRPRRKAFQVEETDGTKDENKLSILEVHEINNQGKYGMTEDLRCRQVSIGHIGCQAP